MYVCLDCGTAFEESVHYVETHRLDTPPYEEWSGCPKCAGYYVEAFKCDCCGEWITGTYVKTDDGYRYCEDCYQVHDIGDED